MGDMRGVKVGDEVVLVENYRNSPPRRVKVTRVGRKYLYVDNYGFDRDTGRASDGYGYRFVRTIVAHAQNEQRIAAEQALRKLGITYITAPAAGRFVAIYEAVRPIFDEEAAK